MSAKDKKPATPVKTWTEDEVRGIQAGSAKYTADSAATEVLQKMTHLIEHLTRAKEAIKEHGFRAAHLGEGFAHDAMEIDLLNAEHRARAQERRLVAQENAEVARVLAANPTPQA